MGDTFHAGMALPQEVIDQVTSQGGVAEGGKVYGMTTAVQEGVTEDWFRSANQQWYTEEPNGELDYRAWNGMLESTCWTEHSSMAWKALPWISWT